MIGLTPSKIEEAIHLAVENQGRAYCPYSSFPVGAALITNDGQVIAGCNVENASYSLTVCAERVAINSAVAAGQREFAMLIISSAGGVAPCGACRQVMAEFAPQLEIILIDSNDLRQRRLISLCELLPSGFGPQDLPSH